MEPKNFRFGGGSSATILHPAVVVATLIAVVLILALPRNKAVTPFLLAFFMTPDAEVLVVGGVHLYILQLLILAVLSKMASSKKSPQGKFGGGFNDLDRVVVLWSLAELVMFFIQYPQMQAFVKGLGDAIINVGGYVAMRFLILDRDAVRRAVKALAVVCAIQGPCMVSEQFTHQNVFSFIGKWAPPIRNGHVRSEGIMGSLYGGVFAGLLIPLFFWLWKEKKSPVAAYAGLAGATAMVWSSHASTSWMAFGASLVGLSFWPLRRQMRLLRVALVIILVGLHLVMNGPVWSLIEKVDLTGGSSSYHRYMLVDNCIRHFSDWWLIGYKYYGSWGFDMYDLCDQYVVAAVTGGVPCLVLFIMIFKRGYGAIGTARRQAKGNYKQELLLWCLGSALFCITVSSFGINYMYHLTTCFFVLIACTSVATVSVEPVKVRTAKTWKSALLTPHGTPAEASHAH